MKAISILPQKRRITNNKAFNVKKISSSFPFPEDTSSTEISTNSSSQTEEVILVQLKEFCSLFHVKLTDAQIYRYACCHDFDYDSARKAIALSHESPYLHLRMNGVLVDYFHKAVMIPLPRLRSNQKSQVIYIHAARHRHTPENGERFIDNLYYLLNDMSQTREDCQNGVCVIANMKHYGMKNYDMDTILKAVKAVEGKLVPTRFTALLYVDAPKVFMNGWKLLRPLLAPWMAKKVHFIKRDKLGDHLMDGYQTFLPQELGGLENSAEIAEDYVDRKIYEERNG